MHAGTHACKTKGAERQPATSSHSHSGGVPHMRTRCVPVVVKQQEGVVGCEDGRRPEAQRVAGDWIQHIQRLLKLFKLHLSTPVLVYPLEPACGQVVVVVSERERWSAWGTQAAAPGEQLVMVELTT